MNQRGVARKMKYEHVRIARQRMLSEPHIAPSAAHSFAFHQESGLDRRDTLLWNIIPWWDGAIRFGAGHRKLGMERLTDLLS